MIGNADFANYSRRYCSDAEYKYGQRCNEIVIMPCHRLCMWQKLRNNKINIKD
jgi:hypothetical protein